MTPAPVAQWTERLTSDQTVVSSNLAGGAYIFILYLFNATYFVAFFSCFFARFCIQYTYEKTVICRGADS